MAADTTGSSFFLHLQSKDLHQYLRSLPPGILDRLYNHPAICIAVFRELPELAKQFVMRTVFAEQQVPETLVAAWIKPQHHKHYMGALKGLKSLRIWRESSGGIPNRLEMNAVFRSNLKIALCGGGNPWIGSVDQPEHDKHARDIPFLDKYSLERWEAVLHFMTGYHSADDGAVVSSVLVLSGLMKCEMPGSTPVISPAGFQFLLLDTLSQVWYFMLQYLETVESRGMDLVECLTFLFQISFATVGKDYSTEGMSESQLKFLQHLREFGLVFQRKRKSRRYYPTRLAINLASTGMAGNPSARSSDQKGFIVVETNYRLYAYTESSFQVALIGLFAQILCRFPNFCVAVLTRDSIQEALTSGISAEQILHFLRTRAHPEMLRQTPVIPPTISDQIRLWELERSRMKFTEGVMYNQFLSQADFETLRKYAEDLGVLMWANSSKRIIVVSRSGHDEVKRFWKRQKQNT